MIRSPRNPRIIDLVRLHRARHRRNLGKALLEGPHLLAEAVAAGEEVTEVLALSSDLGSRTLCEQHGIPLTLVSTQVLAKIADTRTPRGPVAVLTIPQKPARKRDILWMLVSEPGNCGTLIRTCAAFGWDVMMGGQSVDPWAPKVLRAGAGGHFGVVIGEARQAPPGALVVASVARGGVPLSRLEEELDHGRQWWLVIGDEAGGIADPIADRADLWCSVPMDAAMESLNAAAAGAIICHYLSGLRRDRANPVPPSPNIK